MTTPIPYSLSISPPLPLAANDARPGEIARVTLNELCGQAGVPVRVATDVPEVTIVLHKGTFHFRSPGFAYIGIGDFSDREQALRVLEVLAHGFHDYAARECVCGRGLFCAPTKRGRPSLTGRAMSAKERMRKHRRRPGEPGHKSTVAVSVAAETRETSSDAQNEAPPDVTNARNR